MVKALKSRKTNANQNMDGEHSEQTFTTFEDAAIPTQNSTTFATTQGNP